MALDKIKDFFIQEIDDDAEDVFIDKPTPFTKSGDSEVKQSGLAAIAGNSQMVIIEPKAFSECQEIADHIIARRGVIMNLQRVTPEQAKRIIDFLSGAVYAVEGKIRKVSVDTFLCTPKNLGVAGEVVESEEAGATEW